MILTALLLATAVFNPKNAPYNARWDGIADDTGAIQQCINDAVNQGVVEFPYGYGKISRPLQVNGALTIRGQNSHSSGLILADPVQDGIVVRTYIPCEFSDFSIRSGTPNGQTSGRMIVFDPLDGRSNTRSMLRNLFLYEAFIGVHFARAVYWQAHSLEVNQFTRVGIWVQNLINHDEGDSLIHGAIMFAKTGYPADCILYQCSSGLKITSSKLVYGTHGILVAKQAPSGTLCDLIISGNSIEEQQAGGACIRLTNDSGHGEWLRAQIIGNQFAPRAAHGVQVTTPGANIKWLKQLTITQNVFDGLIGPYGHAPCIDVDGVAGLLVAHNNIRSNSFAAFRPSYGILIRHYVDGYVGKNLLNGFFGGYGQIILPPPSQVRWDP